MLSLEPLSLSSHYHNDVEQCKMPCRAFKYSTCATKAQEMATLNKSFPTLYVLQDYVSLAFLYFIILGLSVT